MTMMTPPCVGAIHIHSDYSHDGHDSLEHLREVSAARGIRFLGMTDHAEDLSAEIFPEYVRNCDAVSDAWIQVIPGLEFRFAGHRGLHLLALGVRQWIMPTTLEEFFAQTRDTAVMTVLAHPVLAHYNIPQIVLDKIDAIEVWNTNYNTRYLPDLQSIRLYHTLQARRPEVVATVGLDQHDSSNDREVRILVDDDAAADPLAAIKAGRFTSTGRTMHFDAQARLTASQERRLAVARPMLDAANRVHDRVVFTLRRIGIG